MNTIEKDEVVTDSFIVTDDEGTIVTGLVNGNFTKYLYNPSDSEVWSGQGGTITELGNGAYKITFTPNAEGTWILMITHVTYFPAGKVANYQCFDDPFAKTTEIVDGLLDEVINSSNHFTTDTVGETLTILRGLVQQNFMLDETVYNADNLLTSGRIRIFTNKTEVGAATDGGSGQGEIATFTIASVAQGGSLVKSYKVERTS